MHAFLEVVPMVAFSQRFRPVLEIIRICVLDLDNRNLHSDNIASSVTLVRTYDDTRLLDFIRR